jgi:hypothetical protein
MMLLEKFDPVARSSIMFGFVIRLKPNIIRIDAPVPHQFYKKKPLPFLIRV